MQHRPSPENYWRGIILFGRNVATYKFALGRALLDLRPAPGQLVTLEELAGPFSTRLCEHVRVAERQGTFRKSRFLDACRKANAGEISQQKLVELTVRLGFNNVIDAFHVVSQEEIPHRFFLDERAASSGIRITDGFERLLAGDQAANLPEETEARWRLVETAWELGVSPALVTVRHDPGTETLFVVDPARKRRALTGARAALSGYQRGHCFYCFDAFSLLSPAPPDVDHFFPHTLKEAGFGGILDGVWNLVLSCQRCNRGVAGKFDRVPSLRLLQRLDVRNEFLIASHHPLRETLMVQTGSTPADRRAFLDAFHREALAALIHPWEPREVGPALF